MFCYQCEQTAFGVGCTRRGVCGKLADTSDLMDLLVETAAGVSCFAARLADMGMHDMEAGRFVVQALFVTVTNVNFASESIAEWIRKGIAMRERVSRLYCQHAAKPDETWPVAATMVFADDIPGMEEQAVSCGIEARKARLGEDKAGVLYLLIYGLKGAAAYMDHAYRLGWEDQELYAQFHKLLAYAAGEPSDMVGLLAQALEVGEVNLKAMELLDSANTGHYGHPEPTQVRITPRTGKCVLVSGHDLRDLEDVLKATAGTGINIYTHGEMLPCNAYPGLKRYPHLAGNYGGAWQDQQKEFPRFPGPILLTTNCLMPPKPDYIDRVFATGLVAHPGVKHLENGDFQPLVEAALAMPGFEEDGPDEYITIGFARHATLEAAPQIIEAVKSGAIKRFFLIGGCDGAKPGRNYYTEFAEMLPGDTVILTLACGKYRFNKLPFGSIGKIPRLLDMGQCNDAYSAVRVALALADAFNCDVNALPLSFILSWYEQKAVAVLLTLLHLGVRNIHLGPSLPAFVTPPVLQTLVDAFAIQPIGEVEKDMAAILG